MNEPKYFLTIKAARVNAGLTQKELGKKLGVSEITILSWETRKTKKISTEKLVNLCEICHCRLDDVIAWLMM